MPSRWVSLVIVAFWLSVMGPLLFRQAHERFEENSEPPGYTIDLVDEAQRGPREIRWDVRRRSLGSRGEEQGEDRYLARTSVLSHPPPEEDVFDLRVHLDSIPNRRGEKPSANPLRVTMIDSTHTVTRSGQLQKTRFQANVQILVGELSCLFEGEVRDGRFYSTLSATGVEQLNRELQPVPVSRHGSILNPLHPLNRIQGLRPGQRWTIPLVDPVRDAFGNWLGQHSDTLSAHVLPEPQTLHWQKRDIQCLVIEYTGELEAWTWVEQTSGLVLKQKARHDNDEWEFVRESEIDGL